MIITTYKTYSRWYNGEIEVMEASHSEDQISEGDRRAVRILHDPMEGWIICYGLLNAWMGLSLSKRRDLYGAVTYEEAQSWVNDGIYPKGIVEVVRRK